MSAKPCRLLVTRPDAYLGVPDTSGLNWKKRASERLLGARYRARAAGRGAAMVALSALARAERAVDRGLKVPIAPELNWKGRAIERSIRLSRLVISPWTATMRRVDSAVGMAHAAAAKKRAGTKSALRRTLVSHEVLMAAPVESGSGLADESGLNWKGRAIERARAIRYRLSWSKLGDVLVGVPGRALVAAANTIFFALYAIRARLQRRKTVKSVLQLSIISHKPFMLSRVFREQGLKSEYFALNVNLGGILNVGWDYALRAGIPPGRRRLLECFYLWTVLARYDVIHSHFKSFLSESAWEFDYLKRLGKVVVFHFRGCDVRHRSLNVELQPALNCCQECEYPIGSCDTIYQYSQVALARKYADILFVTTPDLIDFVPGAEHIPFIHPVGIDFDAIQPGSRDQNVFRVVTSSNHHGIDGTRFIRSAVDRLKTEGHSIELIEVSNVKYRDALSIYKSADVYAGKLRMGYYNNANIETMMLGVPNMSYIRADFLHLVPDCPIINTTPDTVYQRLHYYINRREELRAIGAKGPAFVRAHHDPQMLAQRMIARYNQAFAERSSPHDARGGRTVAPVSGKNIITITPSSSR